MTHVLLGSTEWKTLVQNFPTGFHLAVTLVLASVALSITVALAIMQ
jgi:hypothetical protein